MTMIQAVEELYEKTAFNRDDRSLLERFLDALDAGEVRSAECLDGVWRVNAWVKKGILAGFRMGALSECSIDSRFRFFDKDTYPLKDLSLESGVRLVPGGSSIRRGAYVAKGVTCMPPMYVNVGAWVDTGTLIDSHALVGSCAQVGRNVHVSAAAQIGGVLEPIGASPVIVEDEVLVGGNCGIYEGTLVRRRAVIGSGVVLTRSTPVYDLVRETIYRSGPEGPLEIPEGAVVVAGSRPVRGGFGKKEGLSVYTPLIVKYRDLKTDAAVRLEEWLR